jgi:hypothetical protein
MPSLAEFQSNMRTAIVDGDMSRLAPILLGGTNSVPRLAIHQRHYRASLMRALADKFPATIWLIGSEFVNEAARLFVRQYPPAAPCIAEYGHDFPEFLAGCPGAERVPILQRLAALEWQVGHAAIAVELPPVAMEATHSIAPERWADCVLRVQPGTSYLAASWPVDDLLKLFLSETAPQQYALDPQDVWLEIRGTRGEFSIARLDASDFAFRRLIAAGTPIGSAAEEATEVDPTFNAGTALTAMLAAGLITAIDDQAQGEAR